MATTPDGASSPAAGGAGVAALDLAGRAMLATIFLIDGVQQIRFFDATRAYMDDFGVPGGLLPLVIGLHIGGGLAVLSGLLTRIAALSLAAFSLAAALVFHTDFADFNELNHFWKNVALAGGLVLLATKGAGDWSLDRRIGFLGADPRRQHRAVQGKENDPAT